MPPKTLTGWLALIAIIIIGTAGIVFGIILAINSMEVANDPADDAETTVTTTTTEYIVPNITMQQVDPEDVETMESEPTVVETRATVTTPTSFDASGYDSDTTQTRVVQGGAR